MSDKNPKESKEFNLILDRLEGDKAVLMNEKDECIIPKKMLPKDIVEGGVLIFKIASEKSETKNKEKVAKELLNEILS